MNKIFNRNSIMMQKRKYLFLIIIMLIGLISGVVFTFFINSSDKLLVSEEIKSFFTNLNISNKLDILFNSIISNSFYYILVWLLGLSIFGCFLVIFLLFFKCFILGFGFTSILVNYGFKGILLGFFSYFPYYFLFIFLLLLISYYSINFSIRFFRVLFLKEKLNISMYFKKYNYILSFVLIGGVICSILETYLLPLLLNLFL